jgi:2',3'-cyclic-nucleotide 2'-phosphodiesterase (5'-nucleotidase family)
MFAMGLYSLLRRVGLLFLLLSAGWAAETTVTIYNTGDLHAQTANLPRIAAFVKARRIEDPNVLLVDAGDLFNRGDLAIRVTEGAAMFDLLVACGYDACILGNHGLSHGAARTAELIDRFRFPLTEANAIWPVDLQPKCAQPYRLFELQGVKVAVIGTSSEHMNHRQGDLVQRQRIPKALKSLLPEVRKRADIIVLLTHVGTKRDRQVATELARIAPDGVDLIIGGHDHSKYKQLVYDEASKTVIMHAGDHGRWLGEVVLTWDGERITKRASRLIPITPDMPLEPAVQARRQTYLDALAEDKPVARVEKAMSREEATAWLAGVIRRQTGAHAVLVPAQLARKGFAPGPLSTKALLEAVPCLDVLEFTVPHATALTQAAEQAKQQRVAALCAAARQRKGDGEKWAADMLRLVGDPPAEPAPERTPDERKRFGRIQRSLVISTGPLLLFAAKDLPDGPLRIAYPCTWHDAPCQPSLRGVKDRALARGASLWRLVRQELPYREGAELPSVSVGE